MEIAQTLPEQKFRRPHLARSEAIYSTAIDAKGTRLRLRSFKYNRLLQGAGFGVSALPWPLGRSNVEVVCVWVACPNTKEDTENMRHGG